MYLIEYGLNNIKINITDFLYKNHIKNNIIFIPNEDATRSYYFSDPLVGTVKKIYITDAQNEITEYDHTKLIYIDTENSVVYSDTDTGTSIPESVKRAYSSIETYLFKKLVFISKEERLLNIHKNIKIEYGDLMDEIPEQLMAVQYLSGNEKVLEIGGNIGRNSLVIYSILKQKNNKSLVTLESNREISKQLIHNRDLNGMDFFVENSALSKRNLIQKGWDTVASDTVLEGYEKVNSITLEELNKKYNIIFDTLIIDCEGAFYYILMEMPEILNTVNLIIMENDYKDIYHKNYIDSILKKNNLYVEFSQSGGWGPCQSNFYEVWKRRIET